MSESIPNIKIQQFADQILPILKRRGVLKASIFESVVHRTESPDSDLDLLLEYRKGMTLLDVAALKSELEKALGKRIDLASPKYLHPRIKDQVLKEQIRIL